MRAGRHPTPICPCGLCAISDPTESVDIPGTHPPGADSRSFFGTQLVNRFLRFVRRATPSGPVKRGGTTVAELSALWLSGKLGPEDESGDQARPIGTPVSPHWQRTRVSLVKHLVERIGSVTVDTLTVRDVWALQAYGNERGLAPATVNKITHHVLGPMLNRCEEAGIIAEGTRARVFKGAKQLRSDAEQIGQALTIEERDLVLEAFRGHWASPMVRFMFFTGVRIGEVCGLRQRDIDWARHLLRVQRSRRGKEVHTGGKNLHSHRTIRIPRAALAAIGALRNDDDPEGFVFRSAEGAPLNADNFRPSNATG
jgi:Phage integrase family